MPLDSPPKKTSDFQNPISGLFGKFLNLPATLSKRKRSSRSLRSSSRIAPKIVEAQAPQPGTNMERKDPKVLLERFVADEDYSRDYAQKRAALFQAEVVGSWDHSVIDKNNNIEMKAATIVQGLREFERSDLFGNVPSEAIPEDWTLDMGGQFLTNKARIEKSSELFRISKDVPKGAILHLHFNAELNPERLLTQARDMPNMYIWSIRPLLTTEDLDLTEMQFRVMPAETKSSNIFSRQYAGGSEPGTFRNEDFDQRVWMRWKEFQQSFEEQFGELYKQSQKEKDQNKRSRTCSEPDDVDLNAAEYWIMQKMVLSEEEAYNPAQTVNGVWARFNQATRNFKGLLNYRQVYIWYIENAIDRMIDEKLMYAELRPMLLDKSIPTDDGKGKLDNAAQMRLIAECVDKKRRSLKDPDVFPFGLKIIYCTPRSIKLEKMRQEMADCIDLKLKFPDLICGFDLVGAEDRPNNIGFYYKELVAFQHTCKALNIEIPFMFHAGETLLDTGGTQYAENSNLYDAVALNAKRIGHGFSLMKHSHLIEKFRRDEKSRRPGICIELCPISNELLHLCRNIKEHPYPELLAAGIPCCVNSDNPSLFSNSMSHEFYQIMVGSPTISIYSWKQLALWSLEYSCLNNKQKEDGKRILHKTWEAFCQKVVKDYEGLLNDTEDAIDNKKARERYGLPPLPPKKV